MRYKTIAIPIPGSQSERGSAVIELADKIAVKAGRLKNRIYLDALEIGLAALAEEIGLVVEKTGESK